MNINQPSGKFLKILHRVNDGLFLMGNKKMPERIIMKPLAVGGLNNEGVKNENLEKNEKKEIENLGENINEIKIQENFDATSSINNQNLENEDNLDENLEEGEEFEEDYDEEEEEFEEITENEKNQENKIGTNDKNEKNEKKEETEINLASTTPTITIPIEENDKNLETLFLHIIKLYIKENKEILPLLRTKSSL